MFEITMGWWIAPALVTLLSLVAARLLSYRSARSTSKSQLLDHPGLDHYGTDSLTAAVVDVFAMLIAIIVSLAAWLLWAVLA